MSLALHFSHLSFQFSGSAPVPHTVVAPTVPAGSTIQIQQSCTLPILPPLVHSRTVSDQSWRWGRCGSRLLCSSPLALFTWDFQVCEGDSYLCKWFSPLSKLEVVETDYQHDIWDYIVAGGQRSRITEISHSCM